MQRRGILLSSQLHNLYWWCKAWKKQSLIFSTPKEDIWWPFLGDALPAPGWTFLVLQVAGMRLRMESLLGEVFLALFAGPPVSEQQVSPSIWGRALNASGKWERQVSFPRTQQSPAVPNWTFMHNTLSRKKSLPREPAALGGFHGHAIFFHFKRWMTELKKQNKTEKSFLSPGIFATSLLYNKCTFPAGLRALLSCLGRGAIHSRFTGEGRSHTLYFHSHVVPNQEPPQDTI